jgi:predicted AlkP superfamily phosphohydrolase/phosphomutase
MEVEDAVLWAYGVADAALGELLDALDEDVTVVAMSDHGMGVGMWEVDLNHLLAATGFLKRRIGSDGLGARIRSLGLAAIRRGRRALVPDALWANLRRGGMLDGARALAAAAEVDWAQTQAFSWALGGVIRLNLKGRDPHGTVDPADADAVKRDVVAALRGHAIPEVGGCPVRDVVDSAEVYPENPMAGVAPDLLAFPNLELGCELCPPSLGHAGEAVQALADGSPPRSGVHRRVGIIAACGPLVPASGEIRDVDIGDVAPTLMHLLGYNIPHSMTGEVIEELVGHEAALGREPQYAAFGTSAPHDAVAHPSQTDEELVKERLRDLGYFE